MLDILEWAKELNFVSRVQIKEVRHNGNIVILSLVFYPIFV